jgi:hypothetical protein
MNADGKWRSWTWRRAIALVIGAAAIALAALGCMSSLTAPADAFMRLGSYAKPGGVFAVGQLALGVDIVLVVLVGLLIAVKLSWHPVGWVVLASGALMSVAFVGQGYALAASADVSGLPGRDIAAWAANWIWGPAIALMAGIGLIFPTGRPASTALSRAFVAMLAVVGVLLLLAMLYPGPMAQTLGVDNPIGVEALEVIPFSTLAVGYFALAFLMLIGAGSLINRYRRSSQLERLQLRWVLAAGALLATVFSVLSSRQPWDEIADLIMFIALAGLPISIGIAILRYRLYAIDVIVRRTLIYGALTASLAAIYVVAVIVLQTAFGSLLRQNSLAVAGATLIVATAFRPLQRRLQDAIDRRFYRVRYDAARTAAAFAARLRLEVDLDVIEEDLVATVAGAVKPDRVGLWRRRSSRSALDRAGSRPAVDGHPRPRVFA